MKNQKLTSPQAVMNKTAEQLQAQKNLHLKTGVAISSGSAKGKKKNDTNKNLLNAAFVGNLVVSVSWHLRWNRCAASTTTS